MKPTGKPLEVDLLVCPEPSCRRVGKIPNSPESLKGYCTGPTTGHHKKRRMVKVAFKEQR